MENIKLIPLLFLSLTMASCDDLKQEVFIKKPTEKINPVIEESTLQTYPLSIELPIINEPPKVFTFAEKLSHAALERTTHDITYDGRYIKIAYPMGDVPDSIGVCTDVVIRSYREMGIDLQQLLHEDIRKNFKRYPNQKRWGLSRPDTNIDHRRVPNLRVFFSRHGESLPVTDDATDYLPGDLVTWKLNKNMVHIGIVSSEKSFNNPDRYLIIHNIGAGTELSDMLFDYEITGHYRYGFTQDEEEEVNN
ncbi:MAG: DUF1287 domain-containing protein [Methylococcaceae bacterium]